MSLPNSRVVVLRGSTTVSELFSPGIWSGGNLVFNFSEWIRVGLENRGFSVIAARVSASGWTGNQYNLEIEINLLNNHTSEEARVNAIQAINSITANYGLNTPFSNTTLSVASDAYGQVGANPYSSYDQTNPINTDDDDDWLKGLLTGSGATVLVGGVLLVAILLRK